MLAYSRGDDIGSINTIQTVYSGYKMLLVIFNIFFQIIAFKVISAFTINKTLDETIYSANRLKLSLFMKVKVMIEILAVFV